MLVFGMAFLFCKIFGTLESKTIKAQVLKYGLVLLSLLNRPTKSGNTWLLH